uniref:Pericentrin n=1 Tax=Seriola lalandi dorsalis TaxID=1841481 RepID=A0A3B4XRB0_SERLL
MDEDERQRKLEAGRAKLASFRQKRAKSVSAGAPKKTQKRKGQTVTQNDSSTQDRHVEPAPPSASDTELNSKTNHEPEKSEVQQNQRQKDQPTILEQCPSPVEELRDEELLALTGKEQLKQLQEAVEKRNEIIAKLSSNLQEALASRDQVQLEAQSLAGQIQALQRQLQQVSATENFLRIKSQSGAEGLNTHQQQPQHGHCSQDADLSYKEAPSEGSGSGGPAFHSSVEVFSTDGDTQTYGVLHKLRAELEEERKNSQRLSAELAEEMEKHQHVLSLLEKEKKRNEEERKEREAQLQDLQTQCLEMQQYKEEKEKLNREVLELRKRLHEQEDAERRFNEEVATSALRLKRLEEERQTQEEEMKRLKEEHREEKELMFREEEFMGLKASKNWQNKAKAGVSCDESICLDEANLESGPDQDSMNVSIPGDIMMERYLSSAPLAHSRSSLVNESFEHCSQLDISADHRLEDFYCNWSICVLQNLFSSCMPHISVDLDMSKLSEQQFEETDLEKELLNQQCGELHEELALKDRDLNVLREEVLRSAEELEEARIFRLIHFKLLILLHACTIFISHPVPSPQVTEREHERMVSELTVKHTEELSQLKTELSLELRESMEAAHQAELQQSQTLELEALRLSLTNVHMSQLEHSQVNQEQLERLRELHQRDMGESRLQCFSLQWEKEAESTRSNLHTSLSETQDSLSATQTELASTQASLTQINKALSEAQAALSQTQSELRESQARLEELQTSSKEENQKLEEELKQAWADRDAAACSLEELVSSHKAVLQEKEQKVLHLEEKEKQLQQEVVRLQEEKTLLKQSSEQEVGQLWTQLESMRASRQELGELKEQLLARSSRVDDIERLKTEFNEQKRGIKEQNEAELESLRRYFEQRLRVTEESHREEIALLQLRLVEGALEESVLKTTNDRYASRPISGLVTCIEILHKELLDSLHLQLEEKHSVELANLRSSLALSFKEEVIQVRSDLTDHYYEELQEMKTRHALELEQLKAKLSDSHLRGTSLIHLYEIKTFLKQEFAGELVCLEAALKQERERVQEEMKRLREELQEKHEAEISVLRSDLVRETEKERTHLEKALHEEKEKLKSLQAALDNNDSPQVLIVRQRLEAQYDSELQKAKSYMATEIKELTALLKGQGEERLHPAQERFQEEKAVLEQHLVQKYEISLAELKNNHQTELEHERATLLNKHSQETDTLNAKYKAQLDSLSASHRDQLAAIAADLESKHNAEIVALEAALNSKQNADLERLEVVFQETNQAQLEALEAELTRKHQEESDELEKRMLGNMDTLEATYLKEVQLQLEERHRQDLNRQKSEHRQIIERHAAEQLSIREELRKELAQVHMEKFSAMAAELSHIHKVRNKNGWWTSVSFSVLLKVLELEQQHSTALQELSCTYSAEKEQLISQHKLQLQELRGISARELEACRRELEEESSRQRQHFVEEVELLKVQSEERLQDRINQLKFEEQKEAELENLRRCFTSEQEKKEQSYTGKMSQLTAQLQKLDAVVAQLQAEVGCLQGELEGKRAEMETLDTLLQRRERESQEGGNLLKMLTDDLQTAKEERYMMFLVSFKKIYIFSIIATFAGMSHIYKTHRGGCISVQEPKHLSISVADLSSEDLELTQRLCESLLVSDTQINPGGEEAALNACNRLRHTVDTLLELLNQANTQMCFSTIAICLKIERFSQGREDSAQLLEQHKLLLEQLDQEAKLKNQLQLELHKAEGLLEGYVAEKVVLEESLQQKEAQEERLVEELEDLKVKLHQIEEHTILLRQKEHLSAGLGEREKALLAETERLTQDRLDLQRQAEKDHGSLSQRLRALERELEEQETKGLETELHHKTHTEDLNQRVQALEKQLKHDRQFIEEQAVEREHERDEFQQEIRRLEVQLRQTASVDNKGHRVESLQAVIKDKMEDHASLLAANQQAQRDLAERNEEIDKLAGRIRELEQALLNSAESNRSISHLEQELQRMKLREQELTQDKQALEQQQLSNRLQISALQSKLDETRHCYHDNTRDPTQELRDALDTAQQSLQSKEQEVCKILCKAGNVQRDLNIKEVELKHLTLQLELLTNQNAAHVNELQEQIAALKARKEEQSDEEEMEEETLPSALLQEKNQEIDHLNNEIQRLEQELENTRDNKVAFEIELEDLRSQVEHLQSEIARVRQDKEEEEERLHEVISTLQAELATLGPNLHEVSDSQDGDSINPSPAPSPEPHHYTVQEQERRGGPSSLKQELSLTHSASSRSLRSRLKALQSQLETAVAEKEGLERLLLTQEEEYRGHGEEFGKRLKAEREKTDELQGLLTLKEAELVEMKEQVEEESDKRKLSEEERDSLKFQAEEVSSLHKEKAHLNTLVTDLQKKEREMVRELETLKTKEQEIKIEMEVLRETNMEETVKGELSAESEALRRREGQLQEEIERLRQEATSMRGLIQDLTAQLNEKETSQEEAQKEVLTHAEVTLAKADAALRQKETELIRLRADHQALRVELTAVKQGLCTSTERAEKLHEEGQTKDRALVDLDNDNQQLKAELRGLQEDLALQEEELAYQQKELQQLREHCQQQDTLHHQQGYAQKGEDLMSSLSSPEVLRRLECSEDRIPERFQASVLCSRLSELSALNSTGLDLPQVKTSPRVVMEPPHSRTITPDPATQNTHSPGSVSVSDNFSMLDSLDADKVHELDGLDLTTPPSPIGSISSLSAPEWASDGYGSNVSSELGARLRVELEQTERLDAQFVEYLRCRGMNPTVNTDSAAGSMSYSDDLLSPELQGLLKKVYQESCRILTLSQRHSSTLLDKSSSNPPMSWQQEKRALQETVIALRELLCRMAERHTQVSFCIFLNEGENDWHRDQLHTDGQVESHLKVELEESRTQLKCAHDTQQEQNNKMQSLRYTYILYNSNILLSSEQQRSEVMALKGQVEQEKVSCSNLRRELQIEQSRKKTRLERLLTEAESRLGEIHSKLADAHRKLDEERDRSSRQVDELSRRHEADAARDRKFISDMRVQLEQERSQGEELAAVTDKLRAELLQSRRKWEEEDRARREELQREQEAATRHRVAMETLKEQKQEASRALEVERERSKRQGAELAELKERLRLLKDKEREREEQWERERRKGRQEQMEKEIRQERANNKLCELELLRQKDQQRMQELQHTLAELEREEKEMAAHRLSGRTTGQQHKAASSQHLQSSFQADSTQAGSSQQNHLLERLLKENSELTERVTSLSQERATLKHRLTLLERQLRRTENELAKITTETENRPINDVTSNSKMQRLYERYLRAESFRKALVYQKRYLLLLLGGFQECEQATLCLIAHMGARPSLPLSSQRRPLGRFRAVVRVVIAVSRMRFLTKKWQKAIRRLSLSGTVNGHAPGPKVEVLRQQKPRSNSDSPPNRDTVSALVPPSKSPFRLHNRFGLLCSKESYSSTSLDPELSLTDYIHHLEKVQQRLVGARQGEKHPPLIPN